MWPLLLEHESEVDDAPTPTVPPLPILILDVASRKPSVNS